LIASIKQIKLQKQLLLLLRMEFMSLLTLLQQIFIRIQLLFLYVSLKKYFQSIGL